jgi:glycosyltransferase involved in cell wall biosynthesis
LLRRWPLVVTVHDVAYHPGDVQSRTVPMPTVRRLRHAARAVIVHGSGLRKELLATGVRPPAGVHAVAHPVLDRHVRLGRRLGLESQRVDGRRRILFFGRVMAYKGLHLLIEASDHVVTDHPDVRFVVAGRGPELDRLRPELERRPWFELHDRYIPDEEVAQLFLDAELVVLPYVEASQSGVAALAAGFGKPVVATDVGELGELVRKTGMGAVVRPASETLAAALMGLLDRPDRLAALAAHAAAAGSGLLSPARIAASTLSVYQAALETCSSASGRTAR